jgi:hypothetical protein
MNVRLQKLSRLNSWSIYTSKNISSSNSNKESMLIQGTSRDGKPTVAGLDLYMWPGLQSELDDRFRSVCGTSFDMKVGSLAADRTLAFQLGQLLTSK